MWSSRNVEEMGQTNDLSSVGDVTDWINGDNSRHLIVDGTFDDGRNKHGLRQTSVEGGWFNDIASKPMFSKLGKMT